MTLTGAPIRAHEEFKFFRFKLHLALLPVTFGALYVGIHAAGLIGAVSALVGLQTLEAAIVLVAVGRRLGFVVGDLRHLRPALKTALAAGRGSRRIRGEARARAAHAPVKMIICGAVFGAVYVFAAYVGRRHRRRENGISRHAVALHVTMESRPAKLRATGATID